MPTFHQLAESFCNGFQAAFPLLPVVLRGQRSGFQLLSWTQDTTAVLPSVVPQPKPKVKSKFSLLPVLVALFLVSYGLLSVLVVEQDRTITSQRFLITSLFSDSTELNGLKGKLFQKQRAEAQAQAETHARSQGQSPSTQIPSTQNAPGGSAQSNHAGKVRKPIPAKPPVGIDDIVDGRRIVKTI